MSVFAVHRGVFDHPMFAPEPYTEREAWLWLIAAAAWKPIKVRAGRKVIPLERGQCAFAERFLATKWRWPKTTVRRFLGRLKKEGMVCSLADRETTLITICNYEKYAFDGTARGPRSGPPADHRRTKEEEVIEVVEDKREAAPEKGDGWAYEVKPKKKAKPRSSIPDDWEPNEVDLAYARKANHADSKIPSMVSAFRNNHQAKGSLMASWSAAWRTWCDNENKFAPRNHGPPRVRQPDFHEIAAEIRTTHNVKPPSNDQPSPQPQLIPPVRSIG